MAFPPQVSCRRPLTLGPRLEAALAMTLPAGEEARVADIGCDHGRLIVTLLERMPGRTGIAADISAPSLAKARSLAERRGVGERLELRLGDGLTVLAPDEADAVILCGMGGELIVKLLREGSAGLKKTGLAVCQPMRGVEELLRFLWEEGWFITEDRVVEDGGRLYEVLCARPPLGDGTHQPIPAGFPEDFYAVGFTACQSGTPAVKKLLLQQLRQAEKRLKTAAGTPGEVPLAQKKAGLEAVLKLYFGGDWGSSPTL